MDIACPSCRSKIALEDVNPSTDIALCRRCGRTYSFGLLNAAQGIDLQTPPSGARFEVVPGGFTIEATTRTWMAAFLVPFTCVWAGESLGSIYGRQIQHGVFDPKAALMGLPFLLGSVVLVGWCAMLTAGVVRVTRQGDELEVFTGVGPVGWRRKHPWSVIRNAREDVASTGSRRRNQGRCILLEGTTRVAFGSTLTEERRYFMLQAIRKMLATA